MSQKIFTSEFVVNHMRAVSSADKKALDEYLQGGIKFDPKDTYAHPDIPSLDKVNLLMPEDDPDFELRNSITLYEALPITQLAATDPRLWTYLTHVTFFSYMLQRRPIDKQPPGGRAKYLVRHWFVEHVSSKSLLLNDISMLWWIAHLTKDGQRDKYRRTKEVFSMLDYTRHLLPGSQGRNEGLRHGVLEFVIENQPLFATFKAEKVRFIMRRLNFVAGYRVFSALSKDEIKNAIGDFTEEILKVKTDGAN